MSGRTRSTLTKREGKRCGRKSERAAGEELIAEPGGEAERRNNKEERNSREGPMPVIKMVMK